MVMAAPTSLPAALKIRKRRPLNTDKNAAKSSAKKVKKAKDVPAEDDNNAGNEKGGSVKVARKPRAKKPRCITAPFIAPTY
jgi:hypothetical protein